MRLTNLLISAVALGALALSPACKKDEEGGDTANPCASKTDSKNPCAAKKNPCAAKDPCAGKNPCAAKKNPCNPCAGKEPAADSLFARLGGKDAITAVVDDMVANVVADKRINKFFAKADPAKLKGHLVNQICEATGGPCKYEGRSMKETHKGMGVSDADFTALVEDLVKALDKHKVPDKEKTELLTALAGMKGDIVEKK